MKYAPRKVYIKESGRYVELSYTDFCRRRESDQTYMDKLFIPWSYVKKKYKLNMPFLVLSYPAKASALLSNAA